MPGPHLHQTLWAACKLQANGQLTITMCLPVESCECVQLVVRPAPGPVRGRRGTEPSAPQQPGGIHKTAQGIHTQCNTTHG